MRRFALPILILSLLLASGARADEAAPAAEGYLPQLFAEQGLTGALIDQRLTNPVTSFLTLTLQNDLQIFDGSVPGLSGEVGNRFQLVPSIPVPLPWEPYVLVNQLVLPVVTAREYSVTSNAFDEEVSGFGDIILANYLTRTLAKDEGAVFGVGPTWIFPSGTDNFPLISQGKYQVGPALLAGYFGEGKPFWGSLSVQQWWSIGGDGNRRNTSQAAFQYLYQFNLKDIFPDVHFPIGRWGIGSAPVVLVDWFAADDEAWSVPIGTGVSLVPETGPLWIRLLRSSLEFDYFAVRPDTYGIEWSVRFVFNYYLPLGR